MAKRKDGYHITPKGLLSLSIKDKDALNGLWNDIRLYCYENNHNAILIDKEGGSFINVTLNKKGKK